MAGWVDSEWVFFRLGDFLTLAMLLGGMWSAAKVATVR